ncbi:MAG: polymer-forming cytoskeletal protein [Alphaproteobacteria bacterium]|nr:polymer-forming cytoskeletal protein [Alphaproteobacteria bacterium]
MKLDFSTLRVPEKDEEVDAFDWKAFPPAIANRKSNFFLIVDAASAFCGKLVTWTAFIHGQVEGLVFAEHVTVEESGVVKGLIFCRTLTVLGRVDADVICDTLHVRGQGILTGAVKHKQVKIEGEGLVTGKFARRQSGAGRAAASRG